MKKVIYTALLLTLGTSFSQAQVGTGFEEPQGGSINYVDSDFSTTHLLLNLGGLSPDVNYTSVGGEIGFATTFIPSRASFSGSTSGALHDGGSGDMIGVTNNATLVGGSDLTSWATGSAYAIEDSDGTIRVEFDIVDLTGTTSPVFTMDLWTDGSAYECSDDVNDRIFIALEIDGGASTFVIIDTDGNGVGGSSPCPGGNDLDAAKYGGINLESNLISINENISAFVGSTVKLIIEADFNSLAERMVFDNIQFTEGTRAGSLPIELTSFSGYHEQGNNIITWTTESEIDNDYMILERSFDGLAFEPITQIEGFGPGTNTSSSYYSYTDEDIFKGRNYYRLLQVDIDGQQSYSKIIEISTPADRATLLYPNPSKDKLVIRFNQKEEVLYKIYNSTGLLLKNGSLSANKYQHEINVVDLIPGQYVLQIIEGEYSETHNFIKT